MLARFPGCVEGSKPPLVGDCFRFPWQRQFWLGWPPLGACSVFQEAGFGLSQSRLAVARRVDSSNNLFGSPRCLTSDDVIISQPTRTNSRPLLMRSCDLLYTLRRNSSRLRPDMFPSSTCLLVSVSNSLAYQCCQIFQFLARSMFQASIQLILIHFTLHLISLRSS